MTPLDFVVAVTLGSAFGRTVTAVDVPASQAVAALVLLVGLQWLLATVRYRGGWMRRAVDSPPVLLWYDGALVQESLRRHRMTEADVHTAAREAGHGSLAGLQAVILQQDGSLGVITADGMGDGSTVLPYVEGHPACGPTLGVMGVCRWRSVASVHESLHSASTGPSNGERCRKLP